MKSSAAPGEQAPPADPGPNNFGGPRPLTGTGTPGLAGTWSDHGHLIENVPRRYNVPTNQTQLLVADSLLIIHHAEGEGRRKPQIWDVDDSGDQLVLKDRYRD